MNLNQIFNDERQVSNPSSQEILNILKIGEYVTPSGKRVPIGQAQTESEQNTRLYLPEELANLRHIECQLNTELTVTVVDATTQIASQEAAKVGSVCALNFASARNPGGGFLGGAKAQEEELCRCSGLYKTLLRAPDYYQTHRKEKSLLYSDRTIYSPRVPFFRVSANAPFLESVFLCSIITAPGPNAGAIRNNQPEKVKDIELTFKRRWQNVLAVARDQKEKVLILGAWGCGAFRNDPNMVANAAKEALISGPFRTAFQKVVFAIPCFTKQSEVNFMAFETVFS